MQYREERDCKNGSEWGGETKGSTWTELSTRREMSAGTEVSIRK